MKKFFTTIAAAILTLSATAQTSVWGYYTGDFSQLEGIGTNSAGTVGQAMYVPGTGSFENAVIQKVKVPVIGLTNLSGLKIILGANLSAPTVTQEIDKTTLTGNAYNTITLDAPFTVPSTGAYVGFIFTVDKVSTTAEGYPIMLATNNDNVEQGLYLYTGTWEDYSNGNFGTSSLQIEVELPNQPDVIAYFGTIANGTTAAKTTSSWNVTINSDGKQAINNIDYTIDVAGIKESRKLDVSIPAGLLQKKEISIEIASPEAITPYDVKLTLDKINGVDNPQKEAVSISNFINVNRLVQRKTVVEEFTGTGCGYCPRGWVGMENLKKNNPENFIGIAFHKYNTSDPMYVANYYPTSSLGISGAPSCNMDRKMKMDPYYGTKNSIQNDFNYYNAIAPLVDVTVKGTWDETQNIVSLEAQTEFLTNGGSYSLAFVLTADGLTGTTSSWNQSNYYSGQTGLPEDMAMFGTAGSSVKLTYDDVMIASSYSSAGKNLLGDLTTNSVAGNTQNTEYLLTLPSKTTLKNAIKKDEVYAVALVIDNKTKAIANAAKARVLPIEEATGIEKANGTTATPTAYYSLNGVRLDAPVKGINIVRMSDGTTRKIMIK